MVDFLGWLARRKRPGQHLAIDVEPHVFTYSRRTIKFLGKQFLEEQAVSDFRAELRVNQVGVRGTRITAVWRDKTCDAGLTPQLHDWVTLTVSLEAERA